MSADGSTIGHYARLRPGLGGDWEKPELVQALDENKDQSYFLCGVPSRALAKVCVWSVVGGRGGFYAILHCNSRSAW